MASTSVISACAIHATAESALPTLASAGANITAAAWTTAGFVTIGSVERHSDDCDLAADKIDFKIVDEFGEIVQTRGMAIADIITMKYYISEFIVPCEDLSETLLALCSNMSFTSHVGTFSATTTFRAVAVEYNGLGLASFPKCRVSLASLSGGFGPDGKGMAGLLVKPVAPSSGQHFSFSLYQ